MIDGCADRNHREDKLGNKNYSKLLKNTTQ